MNYVSAREGVPVPTKPYERAGRAEWVACGCGLKHRPGAFHICIDLGTPAPVVKPKPKKKAAPKKATSTPRIATGTRGQRIGSVVARIDEVTRRYEGGETTTAIAKDLGVARNTVLQALRKHGVPIRTVPQDQRGQVRPSMRALAADQVARAAERYQAGESASALSKEFGVSVSTMVTSLKREGIATRAGGQDRALTPEQDIELGRLYSAGASQADLRAKYGVGAGTITRALRRAGVPVRRYTRKKAA